MDRANLIGESVVRKLGALSAGHHIQFVMISVINRGEIWKGNCL